MQNEIGAVVLAGLSAGFACYGIQELTYGYKATEFQELICRRDEVGHRITQM
jgi:hypothetical protein